MSSGFGRVRASLANCRGPGVHEHTRRVRLAATASSIERRLFVPVTGSSRRAPISTSPARASHADPPQHLQRRRDHRSQSVRVTSFRPQTRRVFALCARNEGLTAGGTEADRVPSN